MTPTAGALPLSLAAAFAAGAAGSLHCVAMCGGISGALGMRARRLGRGAGRAGAHAACYQVGRLLSYAAAGALCGAFGGVLVALLDLQSIAAAMRIVAGLLLIALGMRVLFGWRLLGGMERLGARLWALVAPLARRQRGTGLGGSMLLGMVWGWLPCGLIYSMLLFATLAGGAPQGAATLLCFGLGTLPAMLGGSLLTGQAPRFMTARGLHAAAGVLLLFFGLATAMGPFWHGGHGSLGNVVAGWCRSVL